MLYVTASHAAEKAAEKEPLAVDVDPEVLLGMAVVLTHDRSTAGVQDLELGHGSLEYPKIASRYSVSRATLKLISPLCLPSISTVSAAVVCHVPVS